jgi:hypothetical protein
MFVNIIGSTLNTVSWSHDLFGDLMIALRLLSGEDLVSEVETAWQAYSDACNDL